LVASYWTYFIALNPAQLKHNGSVKSLQFASKQPIAVIAASTPCVNLSLDI